MKKKEERMEKQMAEVMAENKRLAEPLQKAREEVEELRKQLANYDKDKQSLAVSGENKLDLQQKKYSVCLIKFKTKCKITKQKACDQVNVYS